MMADWIHYLWKGSQGRLLFDLVWKAEQQPYRVQVEVCLDLMVGES